LKVLHIWSQAGVSSIISKWQKRNNIESHVIIQAKHDPDKTGDFYGDEVIYGNKIKFVLAALKRCKEYDIIHLHDAWFMIPLIKIKYPKKKIIIHYHGSMVRRAMKDTRRKLWEKAVDKILVSTPDLLQFDYNIHPIYVPNPVDIEHFKPKTNPKNNDCLFLPKLNQSKHGTYRLLLHHGLDVNLVTPVRVDYKELPEIISYFEYCCDIPIVNNEIVAANSMMGLQSMSMKLKTIQHDFTVKSELPANHHPQFTVKLLREIYECC